MINLLNIGIIEFFKGLERDLAAIAEKVDELDHTAERLRNTHPDQDQSIQEHQDLINEKWTTLQESVSYKQGS